MEIITNNIDFNSYRMFYVVAKYKSFSKASQELCISQPAVSIAIKKLEESLKTILFKRDKKGIELTEYGKQLLFYVEIVMNTLDTATKRLKEGKNLSDGEVRIGVPTHIGIFLISEIIEKFKNLYPGIKFYIESRSTKDMLNMLVKREIDLIIDTSPLGENVNGMETVALMKFDNCFAANNKYIKLSNKMIDFKELNKYQLLLPAERTSTRIALEEIVKKENKNLKLNPIIEVSTTELMYDLVKRGLGIGYFTKSSIANDIINHNLYEIRTIMPLPKTEICAAYIPEFLSNASNAFIEVTKNEINKKKIRALKNLRIIFTQACNYNCSFCHKEGIRRTIENRLSPDNIVQVFKFLQNTYNIGKVHFTGGEPFLNKNLLEVVEKLKKERANITITSNGYSVDSNDEILELIDKLNISVHSLNEGDYEEITRLNGSYGIAISNIKKIRSNYPLLKLEINTTLTKKLAENCAGLEDLIRFAKSIKADIKIIELFPNTDKENYISIDKIEPFIKKMGFKQTKSKFRKVIYEDEETILTLCKCTCSEASNHKNSGLMCYENNDIYLSMEGNLNLCRFNNEFISIYEELANDDYKTLKKKFETYFEKIGSNCIYDKEK